MPIEYLNNKTFELIIDRFKKAKKNQAKNKIEFDGAQLELAEAFYLLAKNIIRAFRFQLVDKDDALQEGVMICFEKLHRFNPDKGRAFNFCTTIILNHYRQLYRTAKNYNELKIRYHEHLCEKTNEAFLNALKSRKKGNFGQKKMEEASSPCPQ
jgi:DNA-directed RNA polymerase specialized sigma24 family protein